VLEELAKISIAVAFPVFEASFGPSLAIAHFAPEELRQRILPAACNGDMVVAVSMSEPQAGTALTDLKTTARLADDKIILNGNKRWCSGAGHADAYVVYCRMSDAPGASGIGAVLVEKGTPGFSFGTPESHMGWRGIPSADMYFDGVELPANNLIVAIRQ
jgi:alkylation response protein AidB-like acyl-CoA dehydrogenase